MFCKCGSVLGLNPARFDGPLFPGPVVPKKQTSVTVSDYWPTLVLFLGWGFFFRVPMEYASKAERGRGYISVQCPFLVLSIFMLAKMSYAIRRIIPYRPEILTYRFTDVIPASDQ